MSIICLILSVILSVKDYRHGYLGPLPRLNEILQMSHLQIEKSDKIIPAMFLTIYLLRDKRLCKVFLRNLLVY